MFAMLVDVISSLKTPSSVNPENANIITKNLNKIKKTTGFLSSTCSLVGTAVIVNYLYSIIVGGLFLPSLFTVLGTACVFGVSSMYEEIYDFSKKLIQFSKEKFKENHSKIRGLPQNNAITIKHEFSGISLDEIQAFTNVGEVETCFNSFNFFQKWALSNLQFKAEPSSNPSKNPIISNSGANQDVKKKIRNHREIFLGKIAKETAIDTAIEQRKPIKLVFENQVIHDVECKQLLTLKNQQGQKTIFVRVHDYMYNMHCYIPRENIIEAKEVKQVVEKPPVIPNNALKTEDIERKRELLQATIKGDCIVRLTNVAPEHMVFILEELFDFTDVEQKPFSFVSVYPKDQEKGPRYYFLIDENLQIETS